LSKSGLTDFLEWKKNSSEKSKKNLEDAAKLEAEWKEAKEQKGKGKGASTGQ
jgi:hypothetical protein